MSKRILAFTAAVLAPMLIWRGSLGHGERPAAPTPSAAPTTEAALPPLARQIDDAAEYLARVTGEDGRFEYLVGLDGRPVSKRKYNVLRHAGAIVALRLHRDWGGPSARSDEAIARASDHLLSRYVRPLRGRPDVKAVWSDPREEGGARPSAKLGGAGLAVLALLGTTGDPAHAGELATAQALGRFILYMQRPDGAFHAKCDEEGVFATDFESLYYPREAILALTRLYEADRDRRWLEAAARGVTYLVESRRGATKLPNDHWLLIAIDRLLRSYGDLEAPPATREEVLEHAVAIGRTMLDEQARVARLGRGELLGAFTTDGRTTPTATRLEGLLALEHALGGDPSRTELRAELRAAIGGGVRFLRGAQVRDGFARGAIPGAVTATPPTVRIDYVQHALAAMIGYARTCASADTTPCP